ncbi:MAG: AMP-dependent synthetase/ligase [Gemmataceae bacterium]
MTNYKNLSELHQRQSERLGPRPALRFRRGGTYHEVSWNEYREQAIACAASLIAHGIEPGDRVGLLAENSVQWLIADMGILTAAAVNVPSHAPLAPRQVQFQLSNADVSWLFVSDKIQLDKFHQVRHELPNIKGVVVLDDASTTSDSISWTEFLQKGRAALADVEEELRRREENLVPSSLATIMYTSGTTGNPKGVMLSHGNLLSNSTTADAIFPRDEGPILSWLPFSHIFARTVDHYANLVGGTSVCLADSAETVVEQLREVNPTLLCAVPRFYEKVVQGVPRENLKAVFGNRIRGLCAGGAAMPVAVAKALRDVGLEVLIGYGLTESSPVISTNLLGNARLDTVGPPIPGIEVKIADDGEVLTRGPHVMQGYWSNPQATADAIKDGWLHTGDLGMIDEDGHLKVTGRKKELLVLSNGKKLLPTQIESILVTEECVDQVVVYGEGRPFLTAIVVPNWPKLRLQLTQSGIINLDAVSDKDLCQQKAVIDTLLQRMETVLRDFASWEQVKKCLVLPEPFTVENEELTVSLKLRRNVVFAKYQDKLDEFYS